MVTRKNAAEIFEKWRECRSVLDRKTRVLQGQMDKFLAGEQPMPTDLLNEVLELQRKCVELIEELANP